jgi:hypothetical protein
MDHHNTPKGVPTSPKHKKLDPSTDESDNDDDNQKEIDFSATKLLEIYKEAARKANLLEEQKALIRIITATENQSPI